MFRKEKRGGEWKEELGTYVEMAAAEKGKQGRNGKDALREVRLERGSVDAATLQAHFAKGILAVPPLLPLFRSCHLDIGPQFLFPFPTPLLFPKHISNPTYNISNPSPNTHF